ncbi:MAG TPA: hypothetical protein VFN48_04865 [Solirubrobacteraceae bacterium]|nr:hypothetical protein [Solirubrobacteraceae bacterium]
MLHAMVSAAGRPRPASAPVTTAGPTLRTLQRCYLVGQRVKLRGSGFTPQVPYDIALSGVDFGQSLTDANGDLAASLIPGGLGAGQIQSVDALSASDGTHRAATRFTLTRSTGALFGPGGGTSPRRRVPFRVWDLAPQGPPVRVYLHYVRPSGRPGPSVALGTTTGQCGTVAVTRPLFAFTPGPGTWTLQFDTQARYRPRPAGKVARLGVVVG